MKHRQKFRPLCQPGVTAVHSSNPSPSSYGFGSSDTAIQFNHLLPLSPPLPITHPASDHAVPLHVLCWAQCLVNNSMSQFNLIIWLKTSSEKVLDSFLTGIVRSQTDLIHSRASRRAGRKNSMAKIREVRRIQPSGT